MQVAVGIVARCEAALLRLHDFEHIVNYLRQEVPQWPKADLQDLLTDALRWGGVGWGGGTAGVAAGRGVVWQSRGGALVQRGGLSNYGGVECLPLNPLECP